MQTKPFVWMIQIPNNHVSIKYRNFVKGSWREQGFRLRYYDAVVPETLKKQSFPLQFSIKKRGRGPHRNFSETEKAVWYSHRNLWRFCVSSLQPIIVVEHDILLVEKIDENFFSDHKIIGMGSSFKDGSDRLVAKSAGTAYYLTPEIAKMMLECERKKSIITNSDAYIHNFIDTHGVWKHTTCRQYVNKEWGKTIIHE